eukprot:1159152-Karenia_brevis.AAC.1
MLRVVAEGHLNKYGRPAVGWVRSVGTKITIIEEEQGECAQDAKMPGASAHARGGVHAIEHMGCGKVD